MSTRRHRWRAARWTVAGVILAGLLATLVALPLTVFPQSVAVPRDADVVVVLAGGGGERMAAARTLMDRVVGPPADLLLISDPASSPPEPLCGTAQPDYAIACFTPEPETTAGEAQAIGDLATHQRWDRIAIVTSTYHATRARLQVERCVDAEVQVVAASPDLDLGERIRASARELVALTRDALGSGGC